MQQMRFIRWSVVAVIVVAGAVLFLSQPTIATNGATYSDPITIDVTAKHFVDYRQLDGVGDAVYYRVTVSKATQAQFQVSIPESAATKFAPQLVLFLPYSSTVGPLLPVIQPPKTLALVYPMTAPNTGFDALTQTSSTVRLQAKPNFPEAGTYTFAIYNAGQAAGQFKFFLNQGGHSAVTWSVLPVAKSTNRSPERGVTERLPRVLNMLLPG